MSARRTNRPATGRRTFAPFLQIVRYDAINLQETLTEQLIRRLVVWNWPHLDPTAFRFVIELEKEDTRERLEGIRAAFDMGLKIRAAEIRDLLNLSQPAEEEEFLQNPAYRQSVLGDREMAGLGGSPAPGEAVPSEAYSLPKDAHRAPGKKHRFSSLPGNSRPEGGLNVVFGVMATKFHER